MGTHCPSCGAILYSRRAKLCGICSAPVPEELRFTGEFAAKIASEVKRMERNIASDSQESADEAHKRAIRDTMYPW
jgi:uncharacterized Zn finger protein (UPF0148 family)